MRINVHAGHTKQKGAAPGASGVVHESVEDRKIVHYLIYILRARGNKVYNCTAEGSNANDNLSRIVSKCNKHDVDLDVSVHLNCYNGSAHGTEVEIYSSESKAKKYAKRVCERICKKGGFTDRGVKTMPELYVLHRTAAPAMLVETFFCDSRTDYVKYRKMGGAKEMARAIADGISPKKK
jgi:N-acetylmuramoyl-L-alanine amidase